MKELKHDVQVTGDAENVSLITDADMMSRVHASGLLHLFNIAGTHSASWLMYTPTQMTQCRGSSSRFS
jgi:hypothetical protein